ncbi:type II toxin-antitoxin system RelE/ParE family toxin [Escherichia coli]|nr:type II toxin-antitoxin system RelE/ParE family toxin [Escherichia coli]
MMEIFWTMLASQDRKRIREYIAEQNLMAAIELDERIGYSASSLAGQPYKGRNGRVEGVRLENGKYPTLRLFSIQ